MADPIAHRGASLGDDLDGRAVAIGLMLILAVVAVLRLLPLTVHDWALGDGGLFYVMIGDLIANGFALPDAVSYQGGVIPYAYPPLAFYGAAALEELTGMARVDVMRAVPTLLSLGAVAAMYPLAVEVGPTRRHALIATAFFGALIGITVFLSSGGGLTRSLGLLLAMLATWRGLRLLRAGGGLDLVLTAVLSGLAVLSHPQAGVFLAIALGAAWLTRWRTRRAFVQLALAALGALVLISPWLISVVSEHGIEPFRSAATVPGRDFKDSVLAYLFLFLLTAPVIGLLDLLGQVQQALARRPQLLVWRIGVFALDVRFSPISGAAPASMLAAHGVLDMLVPATWWIARRGGRSPTDGQLLTWRRAVVVSTLVLGFVPTLVGALETAGPVSTLSPEQREAMAWVRDNTPPSTVTVSLATDMWGSDIVSEWFPALSERASVTTTQGLEWSGAIRDVYRQAELELRACRSAADPAACVAGWIAQWDTSDGVVLYVADSAASADVVAALVAGLMSEHGYSEAWSSGKGMLLQPPPS